MKAVFILRLAFLVLLLAISLPRGFGQGGTPDFKRVYIPPTAESPPPRENPPPRAPIPQGWITAGEVVLTLGALVIIIAAARAWRESNVFGRQYRFRRAEGAARRFGATRSGGLMAVVEPDKGSDA